MKESYEQLRKEVFRLLSENKIGIKKSYSLQIALTELGSKINKLN